MAGYLVLALAVPDAFHGSGLAFGVGYLIVVAVHSVALHLDGLGAVLARLPGHRALQPLQRAARGRRRRAGRDRAGGAVDGRGGARVDARRGWATARARAASRSPPPTSSSATGWWSSSPSASRSWPPGSARRDWPVDAELILAVVLGAAAQRGPVVGLLRRRRRRAGRARAEPTPPPRASRGSPSRASASRTTACCSASSSWRRGSRRPSATPTTRSHAPRPSRWAAAWPSSSPPTSWFRRVLGLGRARAPHDRGAAGAGHHPAGHRDRRGGPARRARRDPRRGAGRRGRRALAAVIAGGARSHCDRGMK